GAGRCPVQASRPGWPSRSHHASRTFSKTCLRRSSSVVFAMYIRGPTAWVQSLPALQATIATRFSRLAIVHHTLISRDAASVLANSALPNPLCRQLLRLGENGRVANRAPFLC